MTPVLLNALGKPEPSPEIQRRLRALDPRLYIEFLDSFSKHWSIRCKWRSDDPRWHRVQSGKIPESEASDIIGWIPMDCSIDEAPAYVEKTLRRHSIQTAERVLFDIEKWNSGGAVAQHTDDMMAELADAKYGMDNRVTGKRTRHDLTT